MCQKCIFYRRHTQLVHRECSIAFNFISNFPFLFWFALFSVFRLCCRQWRWLRRRKLQIEMQNMPNRRQNSSSIHGNNCFSRSFFLTLIFGLRFIFGASIHSHFILFRIFFNLSFLQFLFALVCRCVSHENCIELICWLRFTSRKLNIFFEQKKETVFFSVSLWARAYFLREPKTKS